MKCPRCKEVLFSDDGFSMATQGVCSYCSSVDVDTDKLMKRCSNSPITYEQLEYKRLAKFRKYGKHLKCLNIK